MISNVCSKISGILEIVGNILRIFFFIIPLIIIIFVIFDFYKAVVSSEEKTLSKVTKRAVFRIITGIIIFFIPSIVSFIFNVIGLDDSPCLKCVLDTSTCETIRENTDGGNLPNNGNNGEVNTSNDEECTVENVECISDAIYNG